MLCFNVYVLVLLCVSVCEQYEQDEYVYTDDYSDYSEAPDEIARVSAPVRRALGAQRAATPHSVLYSDVQEALRSIMTANKAFFATTAFIPKYVVSDTFTEQKYRNKSVKRTTSEYEATDTNNTIQNMHRTKRFRIHLNARGPPRIEVTQRYAWRSTRKEQRSMRNGWESLAAKNQPSKSFHNDYRQYRSPRSEYKISRSTRISSKPSRSSRTTNKRGNRPRPLFQRLTKADTDGSYNFTLVRPTLDLRLASRLPESTGIPKEIPTLTSKKLSPTQTAWKKESSIFYDYVLLDTTTIVHDVMPHLEDLEYSGDTINTIPITPITPFIYAKKQSRKGPTQDLVQITRTKLQRHPERSRFTGGQLIPEAPVRSSQKTDAPEKPIPSGLVDVPSRSTQNEALQLQTRTSLKEVTRTSTVRSSIREDLTQTQQMNSTGEETENKPNPVTRKFKWMMFTTQEPIQELIGYEDTEDDHNATTIDNSQVDTDINSLSNGKYMQKINNQTDSSNESTELNLHLRAQDKKDHETDDYYLMWNRKTIETPESKTETERSKESTWPTREQQRAKKIENIAQEQTETYMMTNNQKESQTQKSQVYHTPANNINILSKATRTSEVEETQILYLPIFDSSKLKLTVSREQENAITAQPRQAYHVISTAYKKLQDLPTPSTKSSNTTRAPQVKEEIERLDFPTYHGNKMQEDKPPSDQPGDVYYDTVMITEAVGSYKGRQHKTRVKPTKKRNKGKKQQHKGHNQQPQRYNQEPKRYYQQPGRYNPHPGGINPQQPGRFHQMRQGFNQQPEGINPQQPGGINPKQPEGINPQQPAGVNQQPGGFNQQPVGVNQQSGGNNQQPGGVNQQPGGNNQQPGGVNQQPGGVNQQPGEVNQQPGGNNQQPGEVNQQPGGVNQQPGGNNQQPGGVNQQPGGNNQQPGGVNQQSGGNNQQPGGVNQQPGGVNQQPGEVNQQPGGNNQQPGEVNQQPGGVNQQPGGNNQQPGGFNQQPGGFNQQPGGVNQQPGGFNQQPGGFNQQPGGFNQQPGGFNQQPGGFNQQPGGFNQQPGGFNQQPGGFNQQPGDYNQLPGGNLYYQNTSETNADLKNVSKTTAFDVDMFLEILANLTYDYDTNLTLVMKMELQDRGAPTCGTPKGWYEWMGWPNFTYPTVTAPTTTTEPVYEAPKSLNDTVIAKCFVCGLKEPGIPFSSDCADAFAGDFLPLVPINPIAKARATSYRKYCRYGEIYNYHENSTRPKSVYGRWTGGCSVRWTDLTGLYTQRTCRNRRRPVTGRHYASKRMAKLEMALSHTDDGCIITPAATLLPMSRGVSLYSRFHACVCTGNWCNRAPSAATPAPGLALLAAAASTRHTLRAL